MPADNAKLLTSILEGADLDKIDAADAQTGGDPPRRRRTTASTSPPPPPPPPDPLATGMEDEEDLDDEVEEEAEKSKNKSEEKPKHSPRATQLAEFYGLNPEWVKEATTEELVTEINLARAETEARDRFEKKQVEKKKADEEAVKPEEDGLDLGEVEEEDDAGKPVKRKATLKDISPIVGRVVQSQAKEIKELKKIAAELARRERAREAEKIDHAIDSGFASLPKEYQEIFGDGDSSTIDPKSQEYQDRVTIIRASGATEGDTPAQIKKKVMETAKRVYGRFVEVEKEEAGHKNGTGKKAPPKQVDPLEERRKLFAGAGASKPTSTRKEKSSHLEQLLDDLTGTDDSEGSEEDRFFGGK